jgi:hypothetical protein
MNADIIEAQKELLRGYYLKIHYEKPDWNTVMQWIEADLQTLEMDSAVVLAENILSDRFEVSTVVCSHCKYSWVAVRPCGTGKLECPECKRMFNQ